MKRMMSNLMKTTFPVCASFGPVMLALGSLPPSREGMPYGLLLAIPGAFMTSAALLMVFRSLVSLEASSTSSEPLLKPESRDGG